MIVRVVSYPNGPRVWIVGQRCHHGATGAALIVASLGQHGRARIAGILAGALLCAHDRRDWRVWFKREGLPAFSLDSELSGL